ncbi:MAG: hypothetical protein JPMHGGIA_02760 [Saprospiraceae bacterium]|jgi:hypothetical protein|nr:hypothetical protein [Saprospiraceae bacterium]
MKPTTKLFIVAITLGYTIFLFNVQQAYAQTPDSVAKAMIGAHRPGEAYSITVESSKGKGLFQLKETAYNLFYTDTKELGEKGWAQPWLNEIDRLHVAQGVSSDEISILGSRGLASNRKITRERFSTYVSRLKLMTPEMVQRWETATNQIQKGVSNLVLVGLLVGHDSLFVVTDSIAYTAREQRELKRFQSIPTEVINVWATALTRKFEPEFLGQSEPYGWSGIPPSIDIAFGLLLVDSLFVGDIFQQSVFDAAFPIAQKLLDTQ